MAVGTVDDVTGNKSTVAALVGLRQRQCTMISLRTRIDIHRHLLILLVIPIPGECHEGCGLHLGDVWIQIWIIVFVSYILLFGIELSVVVVVTPPLNHHVIITVIVAVPHLHDEGSLLFFVGLTSLLGYGEITVTTFCSINKVSCQFQHSTRTLCITTNNCQSFGRSGLFVDDIELIGVANESPKPAAFTETRLIAILIGLCNTAEVVQQGEHVHLIGSLLRWVISVTYQRTNFIFRTYRYGHLSCLRIHIDGSVTTQEVEASHLSSATVDKRELGRCQSRNVFSYVLAIFRRTVAIAHLLTIVNQFLTLNDGNTLQTLHEERPVVACQCFLYRVKEGDVFNYLVRHVDVRHR